MEERLENANLMTEGSIRAKMLRFAVPLFFGQLFQQLYNTADSLIVGNYLGRTALAAVGSSSSLIFLLIGFFNGLSMGAGVVVAHYYGAKNDRMVERAVHTTVLMGLFCGLLLTGLGLLLAPQILLLMGTPAEILPESLSYFRVYFAGSLGFVMYNIFVGILQSTGDSRHPLMFLIISSLLNIVLDLLFVGVMGKGVGYAALATIISQFFSAFLCLRYLLHVGDSCRLSLAKLRLDRPILSQIIRNGLPTGIQNSIISIGNVVVQTNINLFGADAVAGCGAYAKIEGFAFISVMCFSMSLSTFVSQNLGAKQYGRVKQGVRFGMFCSLVSAELTGLLLFAFAPSIVAAFNNTPEVVAFGVAQARTITPFYFLVAFSHCTAAVMRGAGKATVPMFVMMLCWCVIRIAYITAAVSIVPEIRLVFWAYPLTWLLSSLIFAVYLKRGNWMKKR